MTEKASKKKCKNGLQPRNGICHDEIKSSREIQQALRSRNRDRTNKTMAPKMSATQQPSENDTPTQTWVETTQRPTAGRMRQKPMAMETGAQAETTFAPNPYVITAQPRQINCVKNRQRDEEGNCILLCSEIPKTISNFAVKVNNNQQCQCEKNYVWNVKSQLCLFNCSSIRNLAGVFRPQPQSCPCVTNAEKMKMDGNTTDCQFNCNKYNHTIRPYFVKNVQDCQCESPYEWNSKAFQCLQKQTKLSNINLFYIIFGLVVLLLLFAFILCWTVKKINNKNKKKQIEKSNFRHQQERNTQQLEQVRRVQQQYPNPIRLERRPIFPRLVEPRNVIELPRERPGEDVVFMQFAYGDLPLQAIPMRP